MKTPLLRNVCIALGFGTASATLGMAVAQHAHGAHVHGEAQAAIAIDGAEMWITLNSAMYNITGFERAPQNAEEKAALASAIAVLKAGEALFVTEPAAGCSLESVTHSLPEEPPAEGSKHNPYRDLDAVYGFQCDAPAQLNEISIKLFDSFANLETLDVVVLKGDTQRAMSLTAAQAQIDLDD